MNILACFVFHLLFVNYAAPVAVDINEVNLITLLQEYIQIDSVTHSDLTPAVEFWKKLAIQANVTINVYEFVKSYPIVVLKWPGTDSSLPSIMLNSHMDVVPADEKDGWIYPPFAGHVDNNGYIYGRGTQDTKSTSLLHYEAMRRLTSNNGQLLRDVYLTVMPDEEVGGKAGMVKFTKSKEFEAMNVGVAFDEGVGNPAENIIDVIIHDKAVWQFRVDCYGMNMHGSLLPNLWTTAVGKCFKVINESVSFRNEQYEISTKGGNAGTYTTINLNIIHGGMSTNTIPGHVGMVFDARLGCDVKTEQFSKMINQWVADAGDDVKLTLLVNNEQTPRTIANEDNPYWMALLDAATKMNMTLNPKVHSGAIDGRYLRAMGVPVFGISPFVNTTSQSHRVNEKLKVDVFMKSVDLVKQFIQGVACLNFDASIDSSLLVEYDCNY